MASSGKRAATRTRISGTSCSVDLERALPERDAGKDLDWNTVGNICTKYLEDEVAQVAQVDSKYGNDTSRAKKNSKQEVRWKYEHCKHDIMVFRKKLYLGSPLTCWASRGVIDVPLQEIAEFIKRTENTISWDKYLVDASIVKMLSPESDNPLDTIAYMRFEHASCIVSVYRELLYFTRSQYKGGKFFKTVISIDDPNYPFSQEIKHIELQVGSGWVLEPYDGHPSKTLATYIIHSDTKGVPVIVLNQVLKRHSLALRYIKRQLLPTAQQLASSLDCSDEEENGRESLRIERKDLEVTSNFEDRLPTSNFL